MKIEIGEYIRTKDGIITKLEEQDEVYWFDGIIYRNYDEEINYLTTEQLPKYIVKHSKNIIDLIEAGDYVNGKEIHEIDENRKRLYSYEKDDYNIFLDRDIQRVVTKEQFSNMEYRV